ncbi:zinc finger protein [Macleaya cordata]|uniref:Zinc finger protein n=1 Tax=Macleaya cordata TaxID=56857 RepID=A0A200QCG2_MACCD|nr:zinc finger protein [Macleaya cordata]
MKGLILQQQQPLVVEENMSNLTSASGEGIVSSSPHQSTQTPSVKRKRSLPGNPDPDAEVIALSPKTLMATNRFVCEICNKGFQRDQNLQLHRRGHNLPWKLKQRTSKEVKKRVYVCPEPTCVHHDPSRALGDLTGIKKHFCRKHGEKKWKCEKCSKRYAVQSDWKAHSKTCGTREYRCDCGTLFSRRDSFITHRAFCDALAEESARSITVNPLLSSHQPGGTSTSHLNLQPQFNTHHDHFQAIPIKTDHPHHQHQQQQHFNLRSEIPPWLSCPPPIDLSSSSSMFSTRFDQEFSQSTQTSIHQNNSETDHHQGPSLSNLPAPYQASASPHMSATALLQKAAQMGATISKPSSSSSSTAMVIRPHHAHMSTAANTGNPSTTSVNTTGTGFGLGLSSHEEIESGFLHGLTSFGNKAAVGSGLMDHVSAQTAGVAAETAGSVGHHQPSLLQDMMISLSNSASGFDGSSSFEHHQAFGGTGMLNSNRDGKNPNQINLSHESRTTPRNHNILSRNDGSSTGGGGNDGMTRDFLGLRAFSHTDILNMAGFDQCMNSSSSSSHYEQQQNRKPWQG